MSLFSNALRPPDCESSSRSYNRGVSDRARWPVRRFPLGAEPGDDLSATTTPAERIAMVWTLTLEAWAVAGRPLPVYRRDETPVRVLRRL